MRPEEEACGAVVQVLQRGELAGELGAQRASQLTADARALGLFGTLAALCFPIEGPPPAPDQAVRDELPQTLRRDLADALGEDGPLPQLLGKYAATKGERGKDLLRRLVARVVHELYDLSSHRLVQDDALLAAELLAAGGPGCDAREAARRMVRLSRSAAQNVLGHLDQQLDLVHEIGQSQGELPLAEIDRRMQDYAPRLFAQRLPAMIRRLVNDEPRLRLSFVLWGRLRGIALGRTAIQGIAAFVVPERPDALVRALAERGAVLTALRAADDDWPLAATIEAVFRA